MSFIAEVRPDGHDDSNVLPLSEGSEAEAKVAGDKLKALIRT
jgi:hypothetical protein